MNIVALLSIVLVLLALVWAVICLPGGGRRSRSATAQFEARLRQNITKSKRSGDGKSGGSSCGGCGS